MKQFFCPVCKSPIACTYKKPNLYFYQDENDNVVRDTNEDTIHDMQPHFHFHCSDDMEDDIKALDSLDEFINWKKDYKITIVKILILEGLVI